MPGVSLEDFTIGLDEVLKKEKTMIKNKFNNLSQLFSQFIIKLKSKNNINTIFVNIAWLFFDKIIRMGLSLFVGVWVARYLEPEQFGVLNAAIALTAVTFSIASFGIDNILIKNLVNCPEKRNAMLGSAFALKLLGSFIAIIFTVFYAMITYGVESNSFKIILIISFSIIFQAFDVVDLWYQSQVKSKVVVIVRNIAFFMTSMIKILLIIFKFNIFYFALIYLLEYVIVALGFYYVYKKYEGLSNLIIDWFYIRSLISDGWPFLLATISGAIYMRVDQVMLGKMIGNTEVGYYSAAVRICEVFYIIPMAISSSLFPNILKTRELSKEVYLHKVQKLFNLMSFCSYLIAIPVTIFSNQIIYVLFGRQYSAAAPMLIILIWSNLFVNLGVARSSYLIAENFYKTYLITMITGCLTNIIMNIILIPHYGGIGAAYATLISYSMAAYFSCFLIRTLWPVAGMLTKSIVYPDVIWKW